MTTNEKKLVIKINCQPPKQDKNNVKKKQQQIISEWNVRRIVITGLVFLLFIAVLVSLLLLRNEEELKPVDVKSVSTAVDQNVTQHTLESSDDISKNKGKTKYPVGLKSLPQKNTYKEGKGRKKSALNKTNRLSNAISGDKQRDIGLVNGLARAKLTKAIINKEPVGNVNLPIIVSNEHAIGVFYFTELTGLKGRTVYHEWKYNGHIIYKRRISILGNRWRASTRKMINYKLIGAWQVRLIDAKGRVMHEIKFDVVE
jgi:hypothetical protein